MDKTSFALTFIIFGLGITCLFFPIPFYKELGVLSGYNMLGILGFIIVGIIFIIGVSMDSKFRIKAAYIVGLFSWCVIIILNCLSIYICFDTLSTSGGFFGPSKDILDTVYLPGLVNAIITICITSLGLTLGTIVHRRMQIFLF